MDLGVFAVILAVLVLLLPAYLFLRSSTFPDLAGPSLRQYLPGGEVYPILRDSRSACRNLLSLCKKYGDVYQVWLGSVHMVVSGVPADVAQMLASTGDFVKPKPERVILKDTVPGSLFDMPKDEHRVARKHIRENFNYTMLEAFHDRMSQAVTELCQSLTRAASDQPTSSPYKVIDIAQQLSATTFRIILDVAFGCNMTREERIEFADTADKLIEEMLQEFIGYPFRQILSPFGTRKRFLSLIEKINRACQRFIDRRLAEAPDEKRNRASDVLDAILSLEKRDMKTVISHTVVFALAGSHTVNQMLTWSIYETCCNVTVMAAVQEEISEKFDSKPLTEWLTIQDIEDLRYLKKVWKETCRLHPAGPLFARCTSREVTLRGSGVTVPKGTDVLIMAQRAHTHPDHWTNPEAFDPERWSPGGEGEQAVPGSFVPFSIGPSNCAGDFFANHEGQLVLAELHRRFSFTLGCRPEEVLSCSGWVEGPRYFGREFGEMGLPLRIQLR